MDADRAGAGLGGAAIAIAIALAPGGLSMREGIAFAVAALILAVTFAPILPVLNRLPKIGAPRLSVVLSFEPTHEATSALVITDVEGRAESRLLRVGFINAGPRRIHRTLVNVLVPAAVEIAACDYTGDTSERHGSPMPLTVLDGAPTRYWAEKDVDIPVGALLLYYHLTLRDIEALGDRFRLRVTYDSDDDLYGGERVHDEIITVRSQKASDP